MELRQEEITEIAQHYAGYVVGAKLTPHAVTRRFQSTGRVTRVSFDPVEASVPSSEKTVRIHAISD